MSALGAYGQRSLTIMLHIIAVVLLLYWGRSLFIPLSVALLISFILYPVCSWLERRYFSRAMAIAIALSLLFMLLGGLLALLSWQFAQFVKEWAGLSPKLTGLIHDIDEQLAKGWMKGVVDPETGLLGSIVSYISTNLLPLIPRTLYHSSVSLVLLLLIPIYTALILYYRTLLVAFMKHILPQGIAETTYRLLPEVIITYYNFIKGMGVVYLTVGILNSIGLFLLGVPNPVFFGFVASILTFIPYVGITIGALLPMAVSWLKFDSAMYPLGVVAVFAIVQVLEANVIFPIAVSQRLRINTLITLVVIIAGGILWGAMGMILFVPFVGILKLIADQVEELRPFALLLGSGKQVAAPPDDGDQL